MQARPNDHYCAPRIALAGRRGHNQEVSTGTVFFSLASDCCDVDFGKEAQHDLFVVAVDDERQTFNLASDAERSVSFVAIFRQSTERMD